MGVQQSIAVPKGHDAGLACLWRVVEDAKASGLIARAIDLVALLVHRAVMPATQGRKVRERGRAALSPVADVMPLAERHSAAREAAAAVPVVERAPQRRENRPGPSADLHDAPVVVVPHHHPARVARQAPGRFRGNVRAVLEDGPIQLRGGLQGGGNVGRVDRHGESPFY